LNKQYFKIFAVSFPAYFQKICCTQNLKHLSSEVTIDVFHGE